MPDFTVKKGTSYAFVLAYGSSFGPLPQSIDAFIALDETERFWRGWAAICKAKGKWRNAIMRSLLTLKGLSYAPTGGIIAAATTLPPSTTTFSGLIADWSMSLSAAAWKSSRPAHHDRHRPPSKPPCRPSARGCAVLVLSFYTTWCNLSVAILRYSSAV